MDDVVEELTLLVVGAVDQQRRTDVADRDQVRPWYPVVGEFLVEDRLLGERQAHTAVLGRPRRSGPAFLGQLRADALRELPCLVRALFVVGDVEPVPVLAELLPDPTADLVPPGFLIGVEFKVHRASSLLLSLSLAVYLWNRRFPPTAGRTDTGCRPTTARHPDARTDRRERRQNRSARHRIPGCSDRS